MHLFRTFLGAFYSAALYRHVRYNAEGIGAAYSIFLFTLGLLLAALTVLVAHPSEMLTLFSPTLLLVIVAAAIFRIAMLFSLAVAARLLSLWQKPAIDYPAALRLVGVAYTPVAVIDGVAFLTFGNVSPAMLFCGGVVMTLAALVATR